MIRLTRVSVSLFGVTAGSSGVTRPTDTLLVLITDLYEGGSLSQMLRRAAHLVESGVQVICLLALSDSGTPAYDHENAAAFQEFGIPTFACTPDLFPDLMSAAIRRQDLNLWAASNLSAKRVGGG